MRSITFTSGMSTIMSELTAVFARLRIPQALLAVVVLAACDPAPQGDTGCPDPFACEIAAETARIMRSDIGKNFGGGVVLRNAHAVGQVLVLDVNLPLSKAGFATPVGQRVLRDFGKNLARGFCGEESANEFFAMGLKLRGRAFSNDNALVADQTITSCRGGRT